MVTNVLRLVIHPITPHQRKETKPLYFNRMQVQTELKYTIKLNDSYGEGFKKPRQLSAIQSFNCDSKDIFTVRFDQDDQYLAVGHKFECIEGLGNGDIKLFNLEQNQAGAVLKGTTIEEETPTTCLRWRPPVNKSKHILVSGNSDGSVIHWHAPSGFYINMITGKRLHKILEENNSVLAMDFNFDGSLFATGGRDFKRSGSMTMILRVFNTNSVLLIGKNIIHNDRSQRGHSNRVFSVKFLPDQPNVLISGGWDSNIVIWDVRDKTCVGQFYGPSVSGDSIDYMASKGLILSGSYRTEKQIQLWDFRTRKLLREVKWMGEETEVNKQIYVYTAQFSKVSDDLILAGCTGLHEVKLFDMKRDCQPCGSILKLDKGVYSVDFANTDNKFAFGGGEGVARVIQVQ